MISFKSQKGGLSYETQSGHVRVWKGIADGKTSFVLKTESRDGQEKHDLLLSEEAALAVASLILMAGICPEYPLNTIKKEAA